MANADMPDEKSWYAARCVFRWDAWEGTPYEERLTLRHAVSRDQAIAGAEGGARTYAGENEVFVLWHARHLVLEEDGRTIHRDPDGEMHLDEEEWRIVGVYADRAAAEARKEAVIRLPGFRDEPHCFDISPMVIDQDEWVDGYVTVYPDGRQQD